MAPRAGYLRRRLSSTIGVSSLEHPTIQRVLAIPPTERRSINPIAPETQVVIVPRAEAKVAAGVEESTVRMTVSAKVLEVNDVDLHRGTRFTTFRDHRCERGRHTVSLIPRNSCSSS